MELIKDTNIPFLHYRRIAGVISTVLVLASLASILFGPGLNLGIDFVGGTQVTLKLVQSPDLSRMRDALDALEGDAVVQRFDEPEKHELLIRLENIGEEGDFTARILEVLDGEYNSELGGAFDLNRGGSEELTRMLVDADPDGVGGSPEAREEHYAPMAEAVLEYRKKEGIFSSEGDLGQVSGLTQKVRAYLEATTTAGEFSLLGAESVGPTVGADLRKKAWQAVIFSLVGMLIYIWIRFQLQYGLGAVVALFHDVVLTLGALSLTQRELSIPTIAALLTLVGYSVNDTVVVFDRVRENLRLSRSSDLLALMNASINQTLSRTLITSGTTGLVVLSLYLFGGDVINTFAFVLLIGVVFGTYSSVFVASPVALEMSKAFQRARAGKRRRTA
jgi:preprotein translocase subunit SecF